MQTLLLDGLKILKKACNVISTVMLVLVLIIAFCLVGLKLFGFQIYTVLSGSMSPTYFTGSVVYVKEVDVDDLKKGDVVIYKVNGTTNVTHRIISIEYDPENPDKKMFRTKGDHNETDDGLIDPDVVFGKIYFGLPLLGYVAFVLQLPIGKFIAITTCLFVLLLTFVPDILFGKDDKKKDDKDGATN